MKINIAQQLLAGAALIAYGLGGPGWAEDTTAVYAPPLLVSPNTRAFSVGEKLVFSVDYGIINAGYATLTVTDSAVVNGRPCYHIVSKANSNDFFTSFYRVNDVVESFIDMDGLFSWKFTKKLEEGKYRADQIVLYDQKAHVAYMQTTTRRGTKADTLAIPPYVQDVLSALYYVRTLDLVVGKSAFVDNHSERKIYPLEVNVHKREKVTVPAGKFDCLKVEPFLKSAGIFNNEGQLIVWLTNDDRKIPVLMKTKVMIGSISARLQEIKK
jgi:hypothetical protein